MYDLVDRPVDDLGRFERRILERTRRWVHAVVVHGAMPAADDGPFAAVMRAIDGWSIDDLAIRRPCAPRVDEAEAVLIGIWRLVRADRLDAARATMAMIVEAPHAAAVIAAMAEAAADG